MMVSQVKHAAVPRIAIGSRVMKEFGFTRWIYARLLPEGLHDVIAVPAEQFLPGHLICNAV